MKRISVFLCTIFLMFLVVTSAHAVPTLRIDDGVNPAVVVSDNGAGDVNPTVGVVLYSGALGGFTVSVETGISDPVLGSVAFPHMDLNSVNTGTGSLTIEFSDDAFTPTVPGFWAGVGGTANGTADFAAYTDASNTLFAKTTLITDFGGTTFGPGAFSAEATGPGPTGAPYSITLVANISQTAGVASYDLELKAVPEPTTMILFGMGLIGLAAFGRKKIQK